MVLCPGVVCVSIHQVLLKMEFPVLPIVFVLQRYGVLRASLKHSGGRK